MHRFVLALTALWFAQVLSAQELPFAATDWPWWRGPQRNGVAAPGQQPPTTWSEKENVVWKTPIPGRGHGSPIVVGDQVFLATADLERDVQSVICFDRKTGKVVWSNDVHRGGVKVKGNDKASFASATLACDGERIFINFLNNGGIFTTALKRDGRVLWQTKVTDYILHQGFASSPGIYGALVLVSADNKGKGVIAALDRASGEVVWKVPRPQLPNYASPIVLNVLGKDQLFLIGCDLVTSLDPATGNKYWEIKGSTTECVTSTVTDGQRMFTSGGYPKGHVAAVRADGSGQVDWEINTKVYVPSLLEKGGYLYGVQDGGVAICLRCDNGKKMWDGRLGGGFSASPILVGDVIYASNESGRTFLFKASPQSFELIGENQLGDEVMATPAICGSRIYMRVTSRAKGGRQEMLYCLGAEK